MKSAQEHDPELEKILADLVAFRTVSGDRQAATRCLDYAEAYLSGRGMKTVRREFRGFPALVATTRRTKSPRVILQAHIDVVAAPDACYTLHEKDGKLFGRGVFDMKFAAAIFLKVADALGSRLKDYDFGIMLTTDEEVGGADGVKALLDAGYGAEVCVLPDAGDDWCLETSHKGTWIGRASAAGTAAHGSRPWEGDNAIDRLMDALCEIRGLFDGQNMDSDTLSVNTIAGGAVFNQIADKAEAVVDLRFLSNGNYDRIRRDIDGVAARYGVSMETIRLINVTNTDVQHPLVLPFLRIAERLRGKPLGRVRSLGVSDAHYLLARGIPVILVRPGGGSAHGDNEWIDRRGLHEYYRVVQSYVEEVGTRI
jgi:succinyl-diaminopimelate desuccinylase